LSSISDADGALAYENARCYATQIVRLYRNQLVSSGRSQQLTKRTGVRSLVDIGPSFPNLFEENWDLFCKVGAIEAKDSPAAYLTSLYRFARE
ncbi:Tc toxin subunit A, partial [Pseudomonas viridiflava]|uniref:Tc toxin subunit A n=1 Tax=Pseudomonas viridiflava TaxID=33069 RepID=UPI001F11E935